MTNGGASIARSPLTSSSLTDVGPYHEPHVERRGREPLGEPGGARKGRRVALSATNSMPARRPLPRTSPTAGNSRSACSRRCNAVPIAAQRSISRAPADNDRGHSGCTQRRVMGEGLRMQQGARAPRQDIDQSPGATTAESGA